MPVSSAAVKVGQPLARWAKVFRATHVIPFSSFHCYQREDSIWANAYATSLEDYKEGFEGDAVLLPAFVRVDSETGAVTELSPPARQMEVQPASAFGDNWSEPLEHTDKSKLTAYFKKKQILHRQLGFLRFVVGGAETMIDLNPGLRGFGITFELPRASLMTAVEYGVFDDLLIGNFMRTTLHGGAKLYPHFSSQTAKYSDNGRVNTSGELRNYFFEYIRRSPVTTLSHLLELKSEDVFRKLVPTNSAPYKKVQALYWKLK
jgi:hypothetical protein